MSAPHHIEGLAGRLCLIVDDSRTVRHIARKMLQEAGLRTAEASDGLEGLEACRTLRPDYVLLDWNMPNMNGIECLRAIRTEFGPTSPRIVVCTTENDPEYILAAIESGAHEFIMKPFDAEILLGKLDAAMLPSGGGI
jgi:two-component system chemotaxis response regulator CheY